MPNSLLSASDTLRDRLRTNAALATPFTASGEIDWVRLSEHALDLLSDGLGSVTLFGTTGEGPSIAWQESREAIERFAERGIAPERTVQAVFQCAAADAAAAGQHVLESGGAALLLAPPFYFTDIQDDALFRWFATVFEGMGGAARDVIIYNIPGLTRVTITPALVGRLRSEFPQVIAGVKDSSGNLPATKRLLAEHKDLIILVGHEGHLAEAAGLGASGAISGIANIAPKLVMSLARGHAEARVDPLIDAILAISVVPAIKTLIGRHRRDPAWNNVRPPLHALDGAAAARVVAAFDTALGHIAA